MKVYVAQESVAVSFFLRNRAKHNIGINIRLRREKEKNSRGPFSSPRAQGAAHQRHAKRAGENSGGRIGMSATNR
jgi:hypothetical protein